MKITLTTSRSGSDGTFIRGDVIDVPDDEALRMLDAGQCEPFGAVENAAAPAAAEVAIVVPEVETAVTGSVETAI